MSGQQNDIAKRRVLRRDYSIMSAVVICGILGPQIGWLTLALCEARGAFFRPRYFVTQLLNSSFAIMYLGIPGAVAGVLGCLCLRAAVRRNIWGIKLVAFGTVLGIVLGALIVPLIFTLSLFTGMQADWQYARAGAALGAVSGAVCAFLLSTLLLKTHQLDDEFSSTGV